MQPEVKDILDFTLIFNRYKVRIFNYVLKMTGDRMTTEDIVQNIFLKLYENSAQIRIKESISFWLFRTARNEVYMWFRKQKISRKIFDPADIEEIEIPSSGLPEEIEIREVSGIILKELDEFAPEQKEVFFLKEYGGLSYKEIADIMQIDDNLVKSRLHKVRVKLVSKLSGILK